jgi:predicted 2-oxoglutarate/Fe(II)-dependent dioxygenase YbiX
MNEHPREIDRFALRPGTNRGDSVLLLDQGRNAAAFDSVPGRYCLIAVLTSADSSAALDALEALEDRRGFVEGGKAAFFAAVPGPGPAVELARRFPSIRFLAAANDWAATFCDGGDGCWVFVNPMFRVLDIAALSDRDRAFGLLERLPAPKRAFAVSSPAPILLLSGVFELDLCRHLVDLFDRDGGRETGFMQDADGQSHERFDQDWKRRRDIMLSDPRLVANIRARIGRRVCPEIKKAFQFVVSRTERDLIARYDAETGGHFGHHRDDAGASVAHRRFAMSIPLNDDYDGGEISFPEYNPQGFKPAAGTAIVFSSSILHGVAPVTRARRYVFLTFLFDEAAEKVRLDNLNSARQPQFSLTSAVTARWGASA